MVEAALQHWIFLFDLKPRGQPDEEKKFRSIQKYRGYPSAGCIAYFHIYPDISELCLAAPPVSSWRARSDYTSHRGIPNQTPWWPAWLQLSFSIKKANTQRKSMIWRQPRFIHRVSWYPRLLSRHHIDLFPGNFMIQFVRESAHCIHHGIAPLPAPLMYFSTPLICDPWLALSKQLLRLLIRSQNPCFLARGIKSSTKHSAVPTISLRLQGSLLWHSNLLWPPTSSSTLLFILLMYHQPRNTPWTT